MHFIVQQTFYLIILNKNRLEGVGRRRQNPAIGSLSNSYSVERPAQRRKHFRIQMLKCFGSLASLPGPMKQPKWGGRAAAAFANFGWFWKQLLGLSFFWPFRDVFVDFFLSKSKLSILVYYIFFSTGF